MIKVNDTQTNREKLARVESVLAGLLAEGLRRGFHGSVGLEVVIQDGTIQHMRQRVERLEK